MEIKRVKKIFHIMPKNGFAVLFAVMLASFLITLGISIFSISLREIQITTAVRDSQIAYYVADSARECALYWEVKKGAFPICFDASCASTVTAPISCNGNPINLVFNKINSSTTYSAATTTFFQYSPTSIAAPVSDLIININFTDPNVITTIQTRGHNTGILGRRVERGIQQVYNP